MKNSRDACNLKTCLLCKYSLEGWKSLIDGNRKNLTFKKGETIIEEGERIKGIYFLYEGVAKVHKRWGEDKELILHFAKKGDMIGYRGLGDNKYYPVTATALEPVTVCFIDIAFFESSLKVNHSFTYSLLKFYMNELQETESRMRNIAHMDVKGRLAETLLHLRKRFGSHKDGSINMSISRQDLASYTGTTYETLFRTIAEFEQENIISTEGRKIKLLKLASLSALKAEKKL